MAHPHKMDSTDSHNAKMRKYTEHYGSASGPKDNLLAESNIHKQEGPERSIGFGADASAAKPRGDRPARRTAAANPLATYKRGGAVKHRADGGPTGSAPVSSIEAANMDQAAVGRAMGGRTKHKGGKGTHVNVIVAPQGGGAGAAPMMPPHPVIAPPGAGMPPPMPPKPPMMPPGGPPGMPPGAAGLPMAAGAPGGLPPGIMPPRAFGGRVESLKDEGLVRSNKAEKMPLEGETEGRARGGRLVNQKHEMTAGAVTGVGRLEKIGEKPKNAGRPQAV